MYLGELHNLGKAVQEDRSGFIVKPRTIFWEWLFLSKESPLRFLLSELSEEHGYNVASPLPFLDFKKINNHPYKTEGKVEKLNLSNSSDYGSKESVEMGKMLALCAWFGITDLHVDNLMMGHNEDGQFYCCPIDIECIFEKLELLSQTQLVLSKKANKKLIGFYKALERSINLADLCQSFLTAIDFLQQNSDRIDHTLKTCNEIKDTRIRVVIRPTYEYVNYLKGDGHDYTFLPDELAQLKRGDVPFFFNTLSNSVIKYTGNDGEAIESSISRESAKILPTYFCSETQTFKRDFSESWIKTALCQICRTFDVGAENSHQNKDSKIEFKDKKIFINIKNKWRISCTRL